MLEIGINELNKCFGENEILKNINLNVKTKDRISLIGRNGCGKTTLLKIIAGIENLTKGTISIRKNTTIGYLQQIPDNMDDTITVENVLYDSLQELHEMENKLKEYENKMLTSNDAKLLDKYCNLQDKFIRLGGYQIGEKIGKIQKAFKISNDLMTKFFNNLSGGEKTIISLASLVIKEPDILLLDEPTNHLDTDTLDWLEQYLSNYSGTVILVSHDRYFLNKVSNVIVSMEYKGLDIYYGNYDYYLEERERRNLIEFEQYKNQEKKIDAMKKSIKQLREWGRLAGQAGGESFYKRAANIEKRLEKMEKIEKPPVLQNLPVNFTTESRTGQDVLRVKKLYLSIGDKILLININFEVKYKDRIALIGKNGVGKTTLIKEIIKDNNESIKLGSNAKLGYIPQQITFDNDKLTILEYVSQFIHKEEHLIRSILTKFNFNKEDISKRLFMLSGGEKVRLKLLELIEKRANFLILDEPTNHIDLETKELLEEALLEYQGTLLFISHDRYFINKLATKVLDIEKQKIITYVGNYDDYINHRK
jgi:ATPase components of ABC transporters with duplicated ATPase domains